MPERRGRTGKQAAAVVSKTVPVTEAKGRKIHPDKVVPYKKPFLFSCGRAWHFNAPDRSNPSPLSATSSFFFLDAPAHTAKYDRKRRRALDISSSSSSSSTRNTAVQFPLCSFSPPGIGRGSWIGCGKGQGELLVWLSPHHPSPVANTWGKGRRRKRWGRWLLRERRNLEVATETRSQAEVSGGGGECKG